MPQNDKILTTFETRAKQMILRFRELKKENEELFAMVEANEESINKLKEELAQKEHDLETLKMAKMLEVTDSDLQATKDKVSRLIREVNKCIAVLSGEE